MIVSNWHTGNIQTVYYNPLPSYSIEVTSSEWEQRR